ncbi:MAG TPA: hypothetical protein VMV44_10300 [Rectinemataceae bacterium]|nr:hypothetical protein [Rectinemataceae bacterium]
MKDRSTYSKPRLIGLFAGIVLAAATSHPASATSLPGAEEAWLDAGASAPWARVLDGAARGGASVAGTEGAVVSMASWRDAGAGASAEAELIAAARWEALKSGALMSAEWKSEKLALSPDVPFDTWLLVFSKGEAGIDSIAEYVRGGGAVDGAAATGAAPAELATYGLLRGKDLVILSRRESGSIDFAKPFAVLQRFEGAWIAKTATSTSSYRRLPGGELAIEREVYGEKLGERYLPSGTALFTQGGSLARKGAFETKPAYGVAQWTEKYATQTDAEEIAYWYNVVRDDSLVFSVGDAEPIADARFVGTSALTSGSAGLENLAIADVVLGSDRRATPVLAWALLGRLPSRSLD